MRYDLISVRPLRSANPGRSITVWLADTSSSQIPVPSDFNAVDVIKALVQGDDLDWMAKAVIQSQPGISPHAGTVLAPPHVMQQVTAPQSPDVSSPGHQLAHARGMMQVAHNKFVEHNHSVESGHPVGPQPDQQRAEHFARKFHESKAVVNHYERQGVQDTPEHHSDWEMHHKLNPTPSEAEGGHWKNPGSISMRQAHAPFQMTGMPQAGYGGVSATPVQVAQMQQAARQPQAQQAPAPGQSPEPTPTPSRGAPLAEGAKTQVGFAPAGGAVIPGGRPVGPIAETGVFRRSLDLLSEMMKAVGSSPTQKSLQIIESMFKAAGGPFASPSKPKPLYTSKEGFGIQKPKTPAPKSKWKEKKLEDIHQTAAHHVTLWQHHQDAADTIRVRAVGRGRGGKEHRDRAEYHKQQAQNLINQGADPTREHFQNVHDYHDQQRIKHERESRGIATSTAYRRGLYHSDVSLEASSNAGAEREQEQGRGYHEDHWRTQLGARTTRRGSPKFEAS